MPMSKPDQGETAVMHLAMERAIVARLGIFLLSTYMIIVSFAWHGPDKYMLGTSWLQANWVFFAAGIFGFPMVAWPRTRKGLVPWMLMLGLATVGRTFTVLFGDYSLDRQLQATGWISTWVLAMVAVLQIQASEILNRRGQKWTG